MTLKPGDTIEWMGHKVAFEDLEWRDATANEIPAPLWYDEKRQLSAQVVRDGRGRKFEGGEPVVEEIEGMLTYRPRERIRTPATVFVPEGQSVPMIGGEMKRERPESADEQQAGAETKATEEDDDQG